MAKPFLIVVLYDEFRKPHYIPTHSISWWRGANATEIKSGVNAVIKRKNSKDPLSVRETPDEIYQMIDRITASYSWTKLTDKSDLQT